jgi:hypothetical protein
MLAAEPRVRCSRGRAAAFSLRVRASSAAGSSGTVAAGARVRVTAPVVVYHVPKTKGAATPLQGLEGVVTAIADVHTDGSQLSCTMPLKVRTAARAPLLRRLLTARLTGGALRAGPRRRTREVHDTPDG